MITRDEYEKRQDYHQYHIESKIFVEKERFNAWMCRLCGLNIELNKEYNLYYQILYNTVLYELLTEGEKYVLSYLETLNGTTNIYLTSWFQRMKDGFECIKDQYTDNEYKYFEYRRNNDCHIFLKGYETIQDNGKIKYKRKAITKKGEIVEISLKDFNMITYDIISEYGGDPLVGDKNFDIAKHKLVSPIIEKLFEDINKISLKESLREKL